ncbi:MAG: rRNA pseudouridine synthase, partial [Bdellovibrionales bacterium]|nr:rRNA pseudouridine synthase [Bdellovibrionales bacterium]
MALVRLQKYLSESGVCSRRKAEQLIISGKVRVNGKREAQLGTKIDPDKDTVQVGKKILRPEPKGIILFHKPRQVVTTMFDPEGRRSISDYLTNRYQSYNPVGRLDYESTGLLVLTNDGQISEWLTHPRFGVEKTYLVKVAGHPSEKTLKRIKRGVMLSDG